MTTEIKIPRPGRGGRYPFAEVSAGTVWIAETIQQSESIQNSFAAWARSHNIKLRAARSTMPDGTARVSFIVAEPQRRPDKAHSMEARARILDRQVIDLMAALNAMGAALSKKAATDAEIEAVTTARETMTRIGTERAKT